MRECTRMGGAVVEVTVLDTIHSASRITQPSAGMYKGDGKARLGDHLGGSLPHLSL